MSKENEDFIVAIGRNLEASASRKTKTVPEKEAIVEWVFNNVSKTISGDGISTTIHLHQPFRGNGAVIIKGMNIKVDDTIKFAEYIRTANIFDMYSENNGLVVMTFSYSGLAEEE